MSHVSGRFVEQLLCSASRLGVDAESLIAGTPVARERVPSGRPMLEWDDFVTILERLEGALGGGPERLEQLGEHIGKSRPSPHLRRLAGFSASPEALYRAGERWGLRRAFPSLESRIDIMNDGRIEVVLRIPGRFRACPQLLHVTTGMLRAAPATLGLPHATVTAQIQPRWGEYAIVPPRSASLWSRLLRAGRVLFSARSALRQLEEQQIELERGYRELRTAYAELEEREHRYRALAESAADLVVEVAPDGVLRYVSPSAEELLGRSPSDLVGRNLMDSIHPDDAGEISRAFDDCLGSSVGSSLDGGRRNLPTFRARHREGHWVWLEKGARTYKDRGGERCLVAILRDVSDRMRLDEERHRYRENLEREVAGRTTQLEAKNRELRELQSLLLHAERVGAARDLAGKVAHSINNPLGALMCAISLMIEDSRTPQPELEEILELTERVSDVVRCTLELYREGKVNRLPQHASLLVDELRRGIDARARECKVAVEVCVEPNLPALQVDRPLLLAALENVAANALDWSHPDGELRIEVRLDATREFVEFELRDDGPGVPEENKSMIFEPFFTTKQNGTGLGLPIALGAVRGHDGRIEVADRPGGGAIFTLALPLGL